MFQKSSRISVPYVAYVLLLLSFISLGALVAALAFGSRNLALIAGVALVASLVGAVLGFRAGGRRLRQILGPDAHHNASIFDTPIAPDAVDRYLQHYRPDDHRAAEQAVAVLTRTEMAAREPHRRAA